MIYLNKLANLFATRQIVRETLTQPINTGSIYMYPYDPLDRLAYIINDTYNIFNKHFAVNKVVNVYVPKMIFSKRKTLIFMERADQNKVAQYIKEKCETIDRVNPSISTAGNKNFFYDVSSKVSVIKRKLRTQTEECVYDALDSLLESFTEFESTHRHKYILVSLDNSPNNATPQSLNEVLPSLYKNGFDFNKYFIYALYKNEQYIRDKFKGITLVFTSKTGAFKFSVDSLPPLDKSTEGVALKELLRCIKRIINIVPETVDDIVSQEDVITKLKTEDKTEHVKTVLDIANKHKDINMDEYEVVKAEDKVKIDALQTKDKFINKKMSELLHKSEDDKSTVMLEQYVKTVANSPDDVKSALGAGIIKEIKDEIIKKDDKITTPKEKKLIEKLNNVTIRGKEKENVIKDFRNMKLPTTKYNVETIDQGMTENNFVNFNKSYDKYVKDVHVKRIGKHFSKCDVPLYLVDLQIEDASDKFNYLDKYRFQFKDSDGTSTTVNIKMPKFIDGKFLYMNGTRFVLYNQLVSFPIVKIGEDVIVTTARNKATLSFKGSKYTSISQARLSKGMESIDKDSYKDIIFGDYYDANLVSNKTNIEYAFISKQVLSMKTKNINFTFKYDDAIKEYGDFSVEGRLALGTYKNKLIKLSLEDDKVYGDESIDGMDLTEMLVKITAEENDELAKLFKALYDEQIDPNISDLISGLAKDEIPELYQNILESKSNTTNLVQTHIKIMGRWIPLIYVLMYTNGLFSLLERAKVNYELVYHIDPKDPEKKRSKPRVIKNKQFVVETADAWLIFNMNNIDDISLAYPLTKLDLTSYKTSQLENRDFLATIIEEYGGSVNLPLYLDRFRETFVDPITADILEDHDIPTDFMGVMIYANGMLGTGKSSRDIDLTQQRLRGEESIVSVLYEAMATGYEEYSAKKKRGNVKSKFTMNENDVMNILHELPSLKPYSSLNPINEAVEASTVMFKGHRGSNMDRAYTLEKRMFDQSFYGVIGLSSPAGAGIGISKQLVVDPKITSPKGYLDTKGAYGATSLKTKNLLTVSEALHPFSVNHDDAQRIAMNLSQAQQILPVADSDPMLTSYGMDGMLAKMSNDFTIVAKQDGQIQNIDENSIVIKYADKTKEVRLINTIEKNSAKNFYIRNSMHLVKGMRVGSRVKAGDVIGYNPEFFKELIGGDVTFTPGPIVWIAVLSDDVVYEDSTVISENMSHRCAKKISKQYPIQLDGAAKVTGYKLNGDIVLAGDKLISFNKTIEDDFYNQFMEGVDSELLTMEKKVKRAGRIVELNIHYAAPLNSLSKSLREFIDLADKKVITKEKNLQLHGTEFEKNMYSGKSVQVKPGTKVNGIRIDEGKVLIEYYVESKELMGMGDKGTYNSAIKGIVADIRPDDMMPNALTSKRRVDACLRSMSIGNRKIYSIYYNMAINKALMKTGDMLKEMFSKY